MSFPSSRCAIKSKFSLRYSSFITITILITIRSCPKQGQVALPFSLSGKNGCTLFAKSISDKEVVLNLGTLDGKLVSLDGPVIQRNVPTLIVFRVLRKNEMDSNSIYAIQVGAANVLDLQRNLENKKILRQSGPLVIPGLLEGDPLYMRIQSENMAFDLFWLHMFDYNVDADKLYRESRADWGYLPSI